MNYCKQASRPPFFENCVPHSSVPVDETRLFAQKDSKTLSPAVNRDKSFLVTNDL